MKADGAVDWEAAYSYLEVQLESVLARVADRMSELEAQVQQTRIGSVRSVSLDQRASGELCSVIAADGTDLAFVFEVYRDEVLVREHTAGRSNTLTWIPERSGKYRVCGFVRGPGDQLSEVVVSRALPITLPTE